MQLLAIIVTGCAKLVGALVRLLAQIHMFLYGILPALLPPDRLGVLMRRFYDQSYERAGSHIPLTAYSWSLEPWEERVVTQHLPPPATALILGSGPDRGRLLQTDRRQPLLCVSGEWTRLRSRDHPLVSRRAGPGRVVGQRLAAWPHVLSPQTVSLLAADDLLIHLTAYAVIHRGALTPAWEQDMRLLLLRDTIDWTAVKRKAKQHSLSIPLLYGLTYLHDRMPALLIPDSSLRILTPVGWFERSLYRLLRRLVTTQPVPELGHFLIWLTRPAGGKWSSLRPPSFRQGVFSGIAMEPPRPVTPS